MAEAATAHTNKETAVEVMREELRQVAVEERKSHREAALNRNRSALGEIQDKKRSWGPDIVVEKAKLLKKKPLPMEDYLCLQSALIQDEENISSFLSVANVLSALVRDLSGKNPALQLVAANCCCNIALANTKACASITKYAGPYLAVQLENFNYPVLEVCAWTIGNLAGGSKTAFRALWDQGALERLIFLLEKGEPSLLPSVMYALKHCLHGGQEIMLDSEVTNLTKILMNRMWSNEPETLWLLALLSSREECTELLSLILPKIFVLLNTQLEAGTSNAEVAAAIRILGNTVCETTGSAAEAIMQHSDDELTILFEKLLSHSQYHVRMETLWLLGNLYCHSVPRISQRSRNFIIWLTHLFPLNKLQAHVWI